MSDEEIKQACKDIGIKEIIKNCLNCWNRKDNECWFGHISDMSYKCASYIYIRNYNRVYPEVQDEKLKSPRKKIDKSDIITNNY